MQIAFLSPFYIFWERNVVSTSSNRPLASR
jgi:hypothetical protein